jgi:hypothetical protein
VLPADLWCRLTETQREALLVHELAHLRRRDHWVRRLELVVLGLYWWHPVAWWAQRALHEAEEQCCDAWVVGLLPAAAEAYAEALVETVAFLSHARPAVPVGASGAGQVPFLKRRVIMILNGTTPRALSRAGWWVVLGLGAVLLPVAPTWAQTAPPRDRDEPVRQERQPAARPVGEAERPEEVRAAREAVEKLQAELADLQTHLKSMQDRLHAAQARLARLEGRPAPVTIERPGRFRTQGQPAPAPTARPAQTAPYSRAPEPESPAPTDAPARLPTSTAPTPEKAAPHLFKRGSSPTPEKAAPSLSERSSPPAAQPTPAPDKVPTTQYRERFPSRGGDYEQRLKQLEDKLDRLLQEVKALREQRPPGGDNRDARREVPKKP